MSFQQYLKVVICFIILTDLTKFLLKFSVDEVFKDRGAIDMRRIKSRGKSSTLGMPKAPQVNIIRILKHLSLGMPRLASHLSSSTNYRYTSAFVLFTWIVLSLQCHFILFCLLFEWDTKIWNSLLRESSHSYIII